MKRPLSLLAVLLLTLGLAACGGGDDEGGETEGTATPAGGSPSATTPSGATQSGETVKKEILQWWADLMHSGDAQNVQVREIVLKAVEETIVKSKDPGQALDDAAKEATEAMQEYYRRIGG